MANPESWTLNEHGDSFERDWALHVLDGFPAYQEFWRRHVVPLSFRIKEPDNQFIRPSLPPHLVALADSSYAVFYHVAHGHAYLDRLQFRKDHQDFPRATECLYCFFTHAHSAHEALLHFCCAVNGVLARYEQSPLFEVQQDKNGYPCRLAGCTPTVNECVPVDMDLCEQLQTRLSTYRNLLIHEKPIFLQNAWLPKTRELDKYSGLTGIGKIARDPDAIQRDYRPVGDALVEILGLVKLVAEMVFAASSCHLDGLEGTQYPRDQRRLGKDHKLTRRSFERVRGM